MIGSRSREPATSASMSPRISEPRGHDITLIEQSKQLISQLREELPTSIGSRAMHVSSTRSTAAVLSSCEVMVAATGDDEDNLVIASAGQARVRGPASGRSRQPSGQRVVVHRVVGRRRRGQHATPTDVAGRGGGFRWGPRAAAQTRARQGRPAGGDRLPRAPRRMARPSASWTCPLTALSWPSSGTGMSFAPRDETPLHAGDEVLALVAADAESDLRRLLTGEETEMDRETARQLVR